MQYNSEFTPERTKQQAQDVVKMSKKAFRGHVDFNIMAAYHNTAIAVVKHVAKKGGDLKTLFDDKMYDKGGKEFRALCPQGYDYFHQSLNHAFGVVSEQSPDVSKVKIFARQVADMATVNVAQSTGAFDSVLRK
jgi:hypothetical protein|tara:strand:- start:250 stop:651 length:402 start_codon:yes stop_codon:yes gene_type:complete